MDMVRTADPKGPKGCSMPYDIMLIYKSGRVGQEFATARGLAWHQLAGGEQLHCASLIQYILSSLLLLLSSLPFFVLLNCLHLNPRVLFFSDHQVKAQQSNNHQAGILPTSPFFFFLNVWLPFVFVFNNFTVNIYCLINHQYCICMINAIQQSCKMIFCNILWVI